MASTDGMGGREWLGRFLLWHCMFGGGFLGLFRPGNAILPQLLFTAVFAVGVADFWRRWRQAWRRVAEHYSVYNW